MVLPSTRYPGQLNHAASNEENIVVHQVVIVLRISV